jgi:hypothetical protein
MNNDLAKESQHAVTVAEMKALVSKNWEEEFEPKRGGETR